MSRLGMLAFGCAGMCAGQVWGQETGPSSSASPYVLPLEPGVRTISLLTVGDAVQGVGGPYRMAGIPDGMGAWDNGDGTFTLLLNHELSDGAGVVRRHGAVGAFISKWTIDKTTLEVLGGTDQVRRQFSWNIQERRWMLDTFAFCRFCSADLPLQTAFINPDTGKGTLNRIYMNGEECDSGRAFAHIIDGPDAGSSYELARCGKMSFENNVASPFPQDRTVVVGLDDSSPGQVYVYVGRKQAEGNDVARAGLANGNLYGVKVDGVHFEDREGGIGESSKRFSLFNFGDVSGVSSEELNVLSDAAEVTQFLRPEDGHWDPGSPSDFYFVTTDRFDQVKEGVGAQIGRTRLYRLRFDDITNPAAGGEIHEVLDGTQPGQMYDNMTIDRFENVLIQEDPGNQPYLSKIRQYNIADPSLLPIAEHDVSRFGDYNTPPTPPFNADEETSGIIDLGDILGNGWFAINTQAHYSLNDPELVQGGQLMLLFNPHSTGETFTLTEPEPGIAGEENTVRVVGAAPATEVYLLWGKNDGFVQVPGCPVQLKMADPIRAGRMTTDGNGEAEFTLDVPPRASGRRVLLQVIDKPNCRASNLVEARFE
ncbi:MAG: hypothetical protein KJZ69_18265 [Phycisphaerales bacterium]|nr:hypothetical protein [Phycisphaerales bacterium]